MGGELGWAGAKLVGTRAVQVGRAPGKPGKCGQGHSAVSLRPDLATLPSVTLVLFVALLCLSVPLAQGRGLLVLGGGGVMTQSQLSSCPSERDRETLLAGMDPGAGGCSEWATQATSALPPAALGARPSPGLAPDHRAGGKGRQVENSPWQSAQAPGWPRCPPGGREPGLGWQRAGQP